MNSSESALRGSTYIKVSFFKMHSCILLCYFIIFHHWKINSHSNDPIINKVDFSNLRKEFWKTCRRRHRARHSNWGRILFSYFWIFFGKIKPRRSNWGRIYFHIFVIFFFKFSLAVNYIYIYFFNCSFIEHLWRM